MWSMGEARPGAPHETSPCCGLLAAPGCVTVPSSPQPGVSRDERRLEAAAEKESGPEENDGGMEARRT